MEQLAGALREQAQRLGLTLDGPVPLERLADLPASEAMAAAVAQTRQDLAAAVERDAKERPEGSGPSRLVLSLRASLERAERLLGECRERDRVQAERGIEGCFCLGLGGRGRAYMALERGGELVPLYGAGGEPVPGWREFCPCPEGERQRQELLALRELAGQRHEQAEVEARWGGIGVPKRYREASFDGWLKLQPDQRATLDRLRRWLHTGDWLVLWGQYGVGKTALACVLAGALAARGESVLFRRVGDLLQKLRDTYSGTGSEAELEAALFSVGVLVLDDLGAGPKLSDWAEEKLFRLLSARHDAELRTVLTTNLDPNGLVAYLGPRNWERVREMTGREGVVHVQGRNLRDVPCTRS